MTENIYLKKQDTLISIEETKYEKDDEMEAEFQKIIGNNPKLLEFGKISNGNPRKLALIAREMKIPNPNGSSTDLSLDHLFIDNEGVLNLVEVKRSSDTRIRREVVAQMIEYATYGSIYWDITEIRKSFDDKYNSIYKFFGRKGIDTFWQNAGYYLRQRRMRLLIVADDIPYALEKNIEFINNVTPDMEVLGVVVKRFVTEDENTFYSVRVVGDRHWRKNISNSIWNRETFLNTIKRSNPNNNELFETASKLLRDLEQHGYNISYGRNFKVATVKVFLELDSGRFGLFRILSKVENEQDKIKGNEVYIELDYDQFKAPLSKECEKEIVHSDIEGAVGVSVEKLFKGRPKFEFSKLCQNDGKYEKFNVILQNIYKKLKDRIKCNKDDD